MSACAVCKHLGRTCYCCADRRRRASAVAAGRACRRCESWRGMVRCGPYRGLCARCAAELREGELARGIPGASKALDACDRAEWEESCEARAARAGGARR